MRGRTTAVRLLLESGANVNAASKHGSTPLMAVAWEGDASVVPELLKHGADATLANSERRSALMLEESEGHRAVVKLWLPSRRSSALSLGTVSEISGCVVSRRRQLFGVMGAPPRQRLPSSLVIGSASASASSYESSLSRRGTSDER